MIRTVTYSICWTFYLRNLLEWSVRMVSPRSMSAGDITGNTIAIPSPAEGFLDQLYRCSCYSAWPSFLCQRLEFYCCRKHCSFVGWSKNKVVTSYCTTVGCHRLYWVSIANALKKKCMCTVTVWNIRLISALVQHSVCISDRFVVDKSCSWFNCPHLGGIELWTRNSACVQRQITENVNMPCMVIQVL